jgi:DNA-binding XRE family transcriptional regulator
VTTAVRDKLLASIEEPFALNKTEAGRLFGVSRQAIDSWHEGGIPGARQAKAATAAAIGDLLSRQLKPERIPGIARRPADAYGGLTMLEMIERDRHLELLQIVRASFDWAQTA